MSTRTIETPIGHLTLQADETAVTAIRFGAGVVQTAVLFPLEKLVLFRPAPDGGKETK